MARRRDADYFVVIKIRGEKSRSSANRLVACHAVRLSQVFHIIVIPLGSMKFYVMNRLLPFSTAHQGDPAGAA